MADQFVLASNLLRYHKRLNETNQAVISFSIYGLVHLQQSSTPMPIRHWLFYVLMSPLRRFLVVFRASMNVKAIRNGRHQVAVSWENKKCRRYDSL